MQLAKLGKHLTKMQYIAYINKAKKIQPAAIIKGKATWDCAILVIPVEDRGERPRERASTLCLVPISARHAASFSCPTCNKVESTSHGNFQMFDLECKNKCKSCNANNPIKDWRCSCQIRWYTCPRHNTSEGIAQKQCQQTTTTPDPLRSLRKRTIRAPSNRLSYDKILNEDLRRWNAKRYKCTRNKYIQLGPVLNRIRLSFLSNALRERFRNAERRVA